MAMSLSNPQEADYLGKMQQMGAIPGGQTSKE